ncbi:MAG TPA: protein-disulfide reductase DsbD domain-containing protein [Pyrinomonadaceae bacterium]|jgi:DsbC/DsbD-like thiol-disulfide interchange protein
MKNNAIKFIIFAGLIFTIGAFSQAASAQSISGSIGNGTVKRGGATRGAIVLSIPGGLHVNSNRPNNEYAIPTVVSLSSREAKVSAVSYPRGASRKFSFSDKPISVYEGRASFGFNVTVPASFKGSVVRIRAVVKFQSCNDEVCFPPKTQEVTLSARVQ